jgi:hypothetical protein
MRDLTRWLAALVAGLFLAAAATAQQRDPLQDAKARQQIAAQQAAREVEEVIIAAGVDARAGRYIKAVGDLQRMVGFLENNPDLPDSARNALKTRLERQMDAVRSQAARAGQQINPDQIRRPPPPDRGPDANKGAVEIAKGITGSRAEQLAAYVGLQEERARAGNQVYMSIIKSAVPPVETLSFPDDWAEKSKKRSPAMQLTEKERAIMAGLKKTVAPDFKGQTFKQVLDYLSKVVDAPIIVDPNILKEVGAEYSSPVNLTATPLSARSVLKKVLADFQLTYIVKDETIQVTTPARASETLTTRTYYIGDLIAASGVGVGLGSNPFQVLQQANDLMVLIQTTVEPNSWAYKGGPGTMIFDPGRMVIVVKQTAELHMMLGFGAR